MHSSAPYFGQRSGWLVVSYLSHRHPLALNIHSDFLTLLSVQGRGGGDGPGDGLEATASSMLPWSTAQVRARRAHIGEGEAMMPSPRRLLVRDLGVQTSIALGPTSLELPK